METIQVLDKQFRKSIPSEKIQERIVNMADSLNKDLQGKEVIFIVVLNGAFMFATDILRKISLACKISFLKLASYQGSNSSGTIKQLVGINEDLSNKTLVILEDIVDTGNTLNSIIKQLNAFDPKEILIATLLYKPEACQFQFDLNYIGFTIPNQFIIGFGLDYNGLGRNFEDIFTII